jgi:hypothetical protein
MEKYISKKRKRSDEDCYSDDIIVEDYISQGESSGEFSIYSSDIVFLVEKDKEKLNKKKLKMSVIEKNKTNINSHKENNYVDNLFFTIDFLKRINNNLPTENKENYKIVVNKLNELLEYLKTRNLNLNSDGTRNKFNNFEKIEVCSNSIQIDCIGLGNEQRTCTICFDPILINERFYLRCGHLFHNRCIDEWLKIQSICPNCKIRVPPIDTSSDYSGSINMDDRDEYRHEFEAYRRNLESIISLREASTLLLHNHLPPLIDDNVTYKDTVILLIFFVSFAIMFMIILRLLPFIDFLYLYSY